jgi:DNA-binding transcriptional MerR regulator
MMVDNKEFLIHELAEQANVSVRTIRYYLDEGLLPQPQARGRYALFNSEHLERLELIRRLKDAYLPLKEIRQKMDSLSGEQVRDLLDKNGDAADMQAESLPSPQLQQREPDSSALDYISKLLETHPPVPPPRSISQPFALKSAAPQESVQSQLTRVPTISEESEKPETWRRVLLAPGVELNLRQPPEPEHKKKIQQILDLANRLFRS